MNSLKVAAIQLCSSTSIDANLQAAEQLIQQAASAGCEFIVTPEMTSFLVSQRSELMAKVTIEEEDIALAFFKDLAKRLAINLQIGSLAIKADQRHCFNRSYLIDRSGVIVDHYDKIHLFDVQLSDGSCFTESNSYQAGSRAVIAPITANNKASYKVGMSICYDLRFASLYRTLASNGADIICIPAAFTALTGKAHWRTLIQARAIETGAFIIAAAQVGMHEGGMETFGHSMIISPWGEILAEETDNKPGFIQAQLDMDQIEHVRKQIPSLQHSRKFSLSNN